MATSQLLGVSCFTRALHMIAADNNMCLKEMNKWPEFIDYSYINSRLKRLNPLDLEIFVTGETTDMENIMNMHNIQDISFLLNSIFDGDLSEYFFKQI